MIKEVDEVIRHAVMAAHDREIRSIAIVMIAKGDPEVHMAIAQDNVYEMNAAADMFKVEMLKLMNSRAENKKQRD
jgi:hypothetical protein